MSTSPDQEGAVTLTADNLRGVPHAEVIIFTKDADQERCHAPRYRPVEHERIPDDDSDWV